MSAPVICLGECLVDRLFDVGRSSQDLTNYTDYPGGAPANVAAAIAKLGNPSRLVSALGQDAQGDWLLQVLQARGVDCQIQRVDAATRTVLVQRDETGDRQFIGFSRPDPTVFADAFLAPEWIDTVDFDGVDYLVVGTLGLAYPTTAGAMARARQKAEQAGTKLIIDLNWRPVFWPNQDTAPQRIREFLTAAD
ncbi:MAG: PfkB family carbohydrate kinase, partial [Nodosilinea sp.]